jgi:Tfp pilus assembly protein PilX
MVVSLVLVYLAKLADGDCDRCCQVQSESRMSDGESRIRDGENRMSDGECGMSDGESRISDGDSRMSDGESRMSDGECGMSDGECRVSDGERCAATPTCACGSDSSVPHLLTCTPTSSH